MHKCKNPRCFVETTNAQYCSRSCSHAAAPRRKRRCADGVSVCTMSNCDCGGRKRAKCVICSAPRPPKASKYCSRQCQALGQHQSDDLIQAWLAGVISADVAHRRSDAVPHLASWARIYLLDEAGWKCTRCGWDTPHPKTGKPPLEIDHIDGDRRNNRRDNLVVLCPNCHALTPTYRRYNYKHVQVLKETVWIDSVQPAADGVG